MKRSIWLLNGLLIVMLCLTGCSPKAVPTANPAEKPTAQPAAPSQPTVPAQSSAPSQPAATDMTTVLGNPLPADAAPRKEQVLRTVSEQGKWMSWDGSVYDSMTGGTYGVHDSCTRADKDFNILPNACESWEVSSDGLTWTFKLQKDKVWSDGAPLTADDWVFTLQRYARAEYDFEWFYAMGNIQNWGKVVSKEVPPDELGVKKVDDYTFKVITDTPVPYLTKLFSMVWVVPKHIVKDVNADATWSLDPKTAVSAGPFKLESYDKAKGLVWVANDKYTGPFPPMIDRIEMDFMDPEARFIAYKSGEIDLLGMILNDDLPPSSMAEIAANPELKSQLISWPNFITFYLFFDTWNPPFDNLKVRQAFSHAVDRDAIVNGPLQYQAQAAYTMNPPGFPGESVNQLKDVQKYDPALAKSLMAEAGYPDGQGFPELTMYTREANPALINAAELIAAMLKDNLGVKVQIQNLDYSIYTEKMAKQKEEGKGDFNFALVSYEFDFVDGSNMLGVWGGCSEENTTKADLPGRHTWYNQQFNQFLCDAGSLMNDEPKRNELYRQAEKILVEDVAMVPIYHGVYNVVINPKWTGPALEPNKAGLQTFWRYEFTSGLSGIYKKK